MAKLAKKTKRTTRSKDELVRTQWQQADTGRRRKYYYITAKGRDALTARTEEWSAVHKMVLRLSEAEHA